MKIVDVLQNVKKMENYLKNKTCLRSSRITVD